MSDKKKKTESLFSKVMGKKIYRRIFEELAFNPLSIDELHEHTGYNKSELIRRLKYLISIGKVSFEDTVYSITSDDLRDAFRELMDYE